MAMIPERPILPASPPANMDMSKAEADQLALHKRQFQPMWTPTNWWFAAGSIGIMAFGGLMGGLLDAFTKRDLEDHLRDHWFVFRIDDDEIDKDALGLDGLMVNATGEGTGMFGSPGWLHEVKGNLTFQDLATTEGVIRGDFAFFLPKSKLPSQLMTSQSIDQSPKVAAEFLVPMSAEAEKTVREAMAAANKENGEGSSEA